MIKERKPLDLKGLNIDVLCPDTAFSTCQRCGMTMVRVGEIVLGKPTVFRCLTCFNTKEEQPS